LLLLLTPLLSDQNINAILFANAAAIIAATAELPLLLWALLFPNINAILFANTAAIIAATAELPLLL
jgi:hypothetical protein